MDFPDEKFLLKHEKGMKHVYQVEKNFELKERSDKKNLKIQTVDKYKPKMKELIEKLQIEMADLITIQKKEKLFETPKNLKESIEVHYKKSRPSSKMKKMRKLLVEFLYEAINSIFPGTQLNIYGSVVCGLDDEDSDIDVGLIIDFDKTDLTFDRESGPIKLFMNVMNACNAVNFNVYGTFQARVPIVTVNESMSGIQVDMSLRSADDKLKLFKEYLKIDSRVYPYLKAIKTWAKRRNICHSISGTINSFGYSCIGIAILQTIEPPILPNLQLKGKIMTGDEFLDFGAKNDQDVGELLIEFFKKMCEFNHKDLRISILHGGFVKKEKKLFDHETIFCIEDPLEPFLNFSRHVTTETLEVIMSEFQRAFKILKDGGLFEDIL
eukprot:gene4662-8234_t